MQKTAAYFVGHASILYGLGLEEPTVQEMLKSAGCPSPEEFTKEAFLGQLIGKGLPMLGRFAGKALSGGAELASKAVSGAFKMPGKAVSAVKNLPTGYMAKTPGLASPGMPGKVTNFFRGFMGNMEKANPGAAGAFNTGRTVGNVGKAGLLGSVTFSPFMKS
jgi:hypothetical protein